jgi:hypothetical protein
MGPFTFHAIKTGTAAFGMRWELGRDGAGKWNILRECPVLRATGRFADGTAFRRVSFATEQEARGYFDTYTTPVVAVEGVR